MISIATAIPKAARARLRAALLAKLRELTRPVSRDAIAVEKMPEEMDEAQRAAGRELAIHSLHQSTTVLKNVRAALSRLSDGSYGTCLHCDDNVSLKRLEAVPWAPYCIRCQGAADR